VASSIEVQLSISEKLKGLAGIPKRSAHGYPHDGEVTAEVPPTNFLAANDGREITAEMHGQERGRALMRSSQITS
jgi:hypothetical protein